MLFLTGRGPGVPGCCPEQGEVQWEEQELPQREVQRRVHRRSFHQQTPLELHHQGPARASNRPRD